MNAQIKIPEQLKKTIEENTAKEATPATINQLRKKITSKDKLIGFGPIILNLLKGMLPPGKTIDQLTAEERNKLPFLAKLLL